MSVFVHEYFMRIALNEAQIAYQKDEVQLALLLFTKTKSLQSS